VTADKNTIAVRVAVDRFLASAAAATPPPAAPTAAPSTASPNSSAPTGRYAT